MLRHLAPTIASGIFSFIDIRLWNSGSSVKIDWETSSMEWGEGPFLFVADSKSWGPSGIPLPFQKMIYDGLLCDPKADDENLKSYLSENSVAIFLDGCNQTVSQQINRECQRRMKQHSAKFCRKQGMIVYRLLYHGREFHSNHPLSLRCNRGAVHSKLSDPLESLYLLKGKATTVATRERLYLDLPGDSRRLGFGSLLLGSFCACVYSFSSDS